MNGLTRDEATSRLKAVGPNRLQPATQRAVVLQFLAHFKNPLVLVLLAACGISALTGELTGALIIGLIVVMSVTLYLCVAAYPCRLGFARRRVCNTANRAVDMFHTYACWHTDKEGFGKYISGLRRRQAGSACPWQTVRALLARVCANLAPQSSLQPKGLK